MKDIQSIGSAQSVGLGWEIPSSEEPKKEVSGFSTFETEKKDEEQSLQEMLKEAREKAQERRDSLTLRTNGAQYGDAAMTAYAKLARARNQAQVSAAAGYARRQMVRFQAALSGDQENAQQIKAAIRQLQKAVGRAGKKKRELQREDLLRARQRKAKMEKQNRKAESLRQELGGRRTMRMIRESGYLRETEIDNRLQGQLAATRMELRQQAEDLAAAVKPSLDVAIQGYNAQTVTQAPESAIGMEIDLEI